LFQREFGSEDEDDCMEDCALMLCVAHARLQHLLHHVPSFPDAERHVTAVTVSELTDVLESVGVQPIGHGVFVYEDEQYTFPCGTTDCRCESDPCED
jgi:hypothetical protein